MKHILNIFYDLESEFSKDNISQVIWRIHNTAFSFEYKDELGLFVQNSQKALINFKIANRHPVVADTILHCLESNFPEHLNSASVVSDISRHELIDAFGEKLGLVQSIINGLSVDLLEISYPLLSLNKSSPVTVHQYQYFKVFYPFLVNQVLKNEIQTDENNWHSFLVRANFNHCKFIKYLIRNIVKETGREDYTENQLEILLEYHKTYSQAVSEISISYEPFLPPVSKQLVGLACY